MPRFAYVGKDPGGNRVEGVLDVTDASAAAAHLLGRGTVPLSIAPAAGGLLAGASAAGGSGGGEIDLGALWKQLRGAGRRRPPDQVELQMFTRELHAMVKAGIPIMRSLDILRESTVNPVLGEVITRIRGHLDAGIDLAEAFERENERSHLFSEYYISILRVGGYTGRLEECLLQLAKYLDFQRVTREQITAALRYPTFVVIAAIAAIVIINLFVLPQFEKVFKGMNAELPMLTKVLLTGSRLTVQAWPALLVGSVGAWFGARQWLKTPKGRNFRDTAMLRLPIVGELVERSCLGRFAHALALAMKSGVPLVQGLEIVATTVGNVRFEAAVLEIRDRVSRGESIRSAAASTKMFPHAMLQIIAVGEETGSLDDLLDELAGFYRSEVEYAISRLSARLEPIMITGLGVVILVLALGVFMPMWELGSATKGGNAR